MIAFPTETFYGLGADALNPGAIEKVFKIKHRSTGNPLPVLIRDLSQVPELVESIPQQAWTLITQFWPGPLTLVFRASRKVPDLLTAGTGKIGIRISGDPLARRLLDCLPVPITATSANRSGDPGPTTAQEVLRSLGEEVALILDGGKTPGGMPSTVVDVTVTPFVILRKGQIPAEKLTGHL